LVVLISYVTIFIIHIIIFLILTIIIATITLMERKLLSLVQRRVGPNYIGYRGRLQFIADAIKLLTKHIIILTGVNKILFLSIPAVILVLCYLF
jgi:NADH-quinone oxidoreductase subunit H